MVEKIKIMVEKFRGKKYFAIGTALFFLGIGGGVYMSMQSAFATELTEEIPTVPTKPLPNDILNIIAKQIEDKKKTEIEYVPVDMAVWQPSADFLNLSTKFQEGANTSDPTQSDAAMIFKELLSMDGEWYSPIIGSLDDKPEQMANKLKKPLHNIYGKYNITDKEQDPLKKETWTVKKWDSVVVKVNDANGAPLETNSNLKEIMAMANVYGYYHNWEDTQLFSDYAKDLLQRSKHYAFSMSDIRFDKEILSEEDIQKARSKGNGQALVNFFANQKPNEVKSVSEDASQTPKSVPTSENPSSEDVTSAVNTEETQQKALANTEISESSEVPDEFAIEMATPSNSEASQISVIDSPISHETNSVTSEETRGQASTDWLLKEFETDAQGNVIFPKKTGALSLHLQMTVYKLSGQNSLYTLDAVGNNPDNFNEHWQGWTPDKIEMVNALMNKNWYEEFGISSNSFSTAKSLTKQEIDDYLMELPADLSETRKEVIEKALNTVGYIPYYFGGKPVSSEFEKNQFHTIIAPDSKGRVFRGLDCSGWVNYVIWSATGNKPAAESTGTFIHAGHAVDRASLLPGDVLVRSGTEETIGHIVMFLKWNPDGSMKVIEETGFPQNNVTISDMNISWACRNVLD